MYRASRHDLATAQSLFTAASRDAPDFARPHAALSFVHFQNAFVHDAKDRTGGQTRAQAAAVKAMELDSLDPFSNYAYARAHWIRDDLDGADEWFSRCIALNPNHAQAHYARSAMRMLGGAGHDAIPGFDRATTLSPFDPLRYAMLASRGLSVLADGDVAEARRWIERGRREPNAHSWLDLLAAVAADLQGERSVAGRLVATTRKRDSALSRTRFFQAFPFRDPVMRATFDDALERLGVH
ncbi:MAG: hypothetical protein NXH97_05490 [Rhodobacteraceae bacterium]|nr:hypothetical protein [Paracoccaceae bacterium]